MDLDNEDEGKEEEDFQAKINVNTEADKQMEHD